MTKAEYRYYEISRKHPVLALIEKKSSYTLHLYLYDKPGVFPKAAEGRIPDGIKPSPEPVVDWSAKRGDLLEKCCLSYRYFSRQRKNSFALYPWVLMCIYSISSFLSSDVLSFSLRYWIRSSNRSKYRSSCLLVITTIVVTGMVLTLSASSDPGYPLLPAFHTVPGNTAQTGHTAQDLPVDPVLLCIRSS